MTKYLVFYVLHLLNSIILDLQQIFQQSQATNYQIFMEPTLEKLNKDLNKDICASDLNLEQKKYVLRKRKSKKKTSIKPIEYPVNNRKNGKRVGGWFLSQKEDYLIFLGQNFKIYGKTQCKFLKKLAKFIQSRSYKEVKKFHNQLLQKFGSIQGIIQNYDIKMKMEKCKPPKTNSKTASISEQKDQLDKIQTINKKQANPINALIKTQEKAQMTMTVQKIKRIYPQENEQALCNQEDQKYQKEDDRKAQNEQTLAKNKQNTTYPFANFNHWFFSAPQLWNLQNHNKQTYGYGSFNFDV